MQIGVLMILVIDGYNVLKRALLKKHIDEQARNKFIKQLCRFAKKRGHKIKLIFDGGPMDFPTKEKIGGIHVIYVGANEIADDYIKRYIEDHRSLDILLISSDNDICRTAKRVGIEAIDSKEFYEIMLSHLQKSENQKEVRETKAIKTSPDQNQEFDELMQEATKVIEYKSEDFALQGRTKSKMLSKKERKKLKQIKKL